MGHGDVTREQLLQELAAVEAQGRRAEASLQEHERLYRLLVENSLGLMCTHDLDGVLLTINPAAARSLGYHPEDGIGRNLREFLVPAVHDHFDAYLTRIRQHGTDSGLMRLVTSDGSERVWQYRNVRYESRGPHLACWAMLWISRSACARNRRCAKARHAFARWPTRRLC